MANSPARYRAIPPPQDQAYHSDTRVVGVSGDNLYLTSESIPAEVQARVKWTYFLLGCTILLPWNALINGTSFFLSRLAGPPFYPTFSSYLASVYALTKLVCQFSSTITSKRSSPSRRIFVSTITVILLVTSLCLSTYIRGTPSTFFIFALFNSAALAVSTGYLCTATYAVAALLGTSFLQTVLSGQAAIAVAVSAVQVASSVLSLWDLSPKSVSMEVNRADGRDNQAEEIAARITFGVSVVFVGITLVAYTWLARQPFYKSAIRTLEQHREVDDTNELARLLADDCIDPRAEANSRVYQVFKLNMIFMFSIAYVFVVTLAVFPAITARVRSVNPRIHPLLFTAVHYLVFNFGDLVGRYSCTFPRLLVWSAKKILAMSLSRTVFIPLILLCNVYRPTTTTSVSPIINSDILFTIILLTMGYTNGFVSSIATLAVSSLKHNPRLEGRREDVDVAATLGGTFAIVGLTSGALCSFGVQAMI